MGNFEEMFHLPDLQFIQFCEQQFSLNKGIYNTIDSWFYSKGLTDIIFRRRVMLQFIFVNCSGEAKVKFGPGGLTKKLEFFLASYEKNTASELFVTDSF